MTAWNRETQTVMDSRDMGLQALGSRSLVQLSVIENFFKPSYGLFWNHFFALTQVCHVFGYYPANTAVSPR